MHTADLTVLAAYFVTMIGVGMVYARHMKSLDLYFAGGKQLPWWIGGVSFVMSYVSALSIVVYAGLGYEFGAVALSIYWTTVPATLLITWLLARRWRRAGIITPVEFLETRFSPAIRQVFAWSGIPLKIVDEGLKIVAIGIFVSTGLHISPYAAMSVVAIITLVYTVLGGLWAAVITDFVQFVLVTTAIVLLVPLAWHAAGGWSAFAAGVPQGFFRPTAARYGWTYVGAFMVLSSLSLAGNWSLIQKFYAARTERDCRGTGWLATLLFFLLPPLWILTGMLARAFIPFGRFDPQTIYARVGMALLPPGMFGLVVAALFAATMSVLASGYNVVAAVLTVDVHQRWVRPQATQRELVVVGRILTALAAVATLGIALAVTYFHWTVFNTMVAAFGFFLPPTVLPMLAGLLSRRLSTAGALAGFFAGIGSGLVFLGYLAFLKPSNLSAFQSLSIVIPAFFTTLVLVIAARFFPARGEARERAESFFVRLNRPSHAPAGDLPSPAPIAGTVIAIMGVVLLVLSSGFLPFPRNFLTLGTGATFALLGVVMLKSSRHAGGRPRESASQPATTPAAFTSSGKNNDS
jgi:solute:Na+ symporter, SSS family